MTRGPAEKRQRATYADIEALPPHVVGEIIAGELVVSPRPAPAHAQAASALGGVLVGPFGRGAGGPGGWWIVDEPELHPGIDPDFEALVPHLAGWRRAKMPSLPTTAWFDLVPDWVCEVLSPSTAALDRAEKMPFYARAGAGHAWLVDPVLLTLEVYRLDGESWRMISVYRGNVKVRAEPFDAVEIDLAWLWER
jgi:Uma2 family endonuclease